jgi:hypothetical protein
MHAPDVRPGWSRWLVPRGVRSWAVALSIAWFAVGLSAVIAAEVAYGWRAAPVRHAWHAIAYLIFIGWLLLAERLLHCRRR